MIIKRNRPRPNSGVRPNRPHQNGYSNGKNDDSGEVRLKNRGYYQQMYDKYTMAARESLSLGERIEAEGHFQHAEHYLRQLNDRVRYDNEVQQQQNQRLQAQQKAQQQAQQNQQNQQQSDAEGNVTAATQEQKDAVQSDPEDVVQPQPLKQPQQQRQQQPRRVPVHAHKPAAHKVKNEEVAHQAVLQDQPKLSSSAPEDVSAPASNEVNDGTESGEQTKEKRVYRKRVLRTPHRRYTNQDDPSTNQDVPSTNQDAPSTNQDAPSTNQDVSTNVTPS